MSELALKLIAENKKTFSPFLDLGNCGLTEVPEEVGELVWLEELSFAREWWDFESEKWVPKRTQNNGPKNNIVRLAPAAFGSRTSWFGKLVNSSSFSGLIHLKKLYLNGMWDEPMDFNDLSPLSCLANLQELYVSSTRVTKLSPLSGLANLRELYVSNTPVTDLSPLSGLAKLQRLDVSNTQVTDLSPLSGLANLLELIVWNTKVTDLSPLSGLANLQEIDVRNCLLTYPPAEIVQHGNAAILNFLQETANGTDHLYEAKMLLIGEGRAGKTSLLRRLYQTGISLPDEKETTKGIDIHRHEFKLDKGRNFRLNVWDFGGQEIYHATHQFFLTKRSLYVLLDDTSKDNKTVHDAGFKYWLEVADLLGGHSPVLIFQNEKGGRSKIIDESGIKAKFNNVKEVYRGNLEQPGAADGYARRSNFMRKTCRTSARNCRPNGCPFAPILSSRPRINPLFPCKTISIFTGNIWNSIAIKPCI